MYKYIKVYPDLASKEADMNRLRKILPEHVKGRHFKDIAVLDLESDVEIDFESYGLTGWEVDQ